MPPTELDLPLLPSAEQIRRREFATIRRGYDPEQVRDYLQQVATQVETLERQLREIGLQRESEPTVIPEPEPETVASAGPDAAIEPAPPQPDAYEQLADRLADLIRAADGQAEQILSEAQGEATRSLESARAEADRIRTDAQSHAEAARQHGDEVLQEARREAERVLSTLSARREHLVEQLQQMQSRLMGVAREIETALGPDAEGAETLASGISSGETATRDAPLDPRYEDLWVSSDPSTLNVADIPAIDIDFDDDDPPG